MPRYFIAFFMFFMLIGCSSFQTTKNVWKGTKQLWAEYVSPPAYVDYDDKGDLPPQAIALSKAMLGVDLELDRLEKVMQNADKPPTMEWMQRLFENFPWLSGFAGVKYDGTILGRQPADSLKELDFNYLLHEDSRQKSRALRADVQPSPLGPEMMIAAPLYDGIDFLGIVVAYFDMRAIMRFSENPQDIVVLCPTALLWPGKYDFASTPLAGVDWSKIVRESSSGTCTNVNGTFFYLVRYFANMPIVFAVPESGQFQEGSGGIEQGYAFFPPEREKGTPPPVSEERLKKESLAATAFGQAENPEIPAEPQQEVASQEPGPSPNDLQPGSRESVLLKKRQKARRQLEERALEGKNVNVERVQRPGRRAAPPVSEQELDLIPDQEIPRLGDGRPSPFGPKENAPAPMVRPSPFGPPASQGDTSVPENGQDANSEVVSPSTSQSIEKPSGEVVNSGENTDAEKPATEERHKPEMLPGGRPSPFGPG